MSISGKSKNRETILLVAVAVVGLVGLIALQLANKNKVGKNQQSILQAEGKQNKEDAQATAPIQQIPGQLLRTSNWPEVGRPFNFLMTKSSQGPEYSLDLGDGTARKVFKDGVVTHTFTRPGPCIVTLYATYEDQQIQLDTMYKRVANVKVNAPVGPVVDY